MGEGALGEGRARVSDFITKNPNPKKFCVYVCVGEGGGVGGVG